VSTSSTVFPDGNWLLRAWSALGIRGKHLIISVSMIVIAGGVGGAAADAWVAQSTVARIERELDVLARTASVRVALESDRDLLDDVADDLGAATGARVTLIDANGRVLGDSEIEHAALAGVDNHLSRPEVQAALHSGRGVARRPSSTVADDLLYVARPAIIDGEDGVIRLALPLVEVQRIQRATRPLFVAAGLIFIVLAAIGAAMSSHLVHRRIVTLIERTRAVRGGSDGDDVEVLARTFNALTDELERNLLSLADERDRFDALLQAMDEGVLLIDADGTVLVDNPAARTLLSGNSEALVGTSLLTSRPELAAVIAEAFAGVVGTVELAGGLDQRRRVLVRATPKPPLRPHRRGGCVLVAHDVTDIRRLETLRKDFVANVSHELRTPCSVILANAETLLSGALEDGPRAQKFVEAVHRNAERLSRLIADLLELSKIEAGKVEIARVPVVLHAAVEHVVDAIDPRAREKGQTINVEVSPKLAFEGDPRALEQVLINLVDNAVKYTQAGGHVRISADRTGSVVRLIVEDDGPGVEARHKDRLFERFYRVDAGRSRDVGGTGLGLAIVKHLVEAMGGAIRVEDAVPHGTRFIVELPA
jgi:two-component system phosphate regulon sensor histidine kinase PhoR